MQRITLLLLTALLVSSIAYNQRLLQVLTDANDSHPETVALNGNVIILGGDGMTIYDDETIVTRNYPNVGGVRLRGIYFGKTPLFRSEIYLTLANGDIRYLYRFNGTVFRRMTIPGTIVSSAIVFGDNLYILSQVDDIIKLFRYDGSTVTEIAGTALPITYGYKMFVGNNYLYLIAQGFDSREPSMAKRFNGITTSTIPYADFYGTLKDVLAIGETGRVYFIINSHIVYFDGTVATEINSSVGYDDAVIWRNELHFLTSTIMGRKMYRATGAILTEIVPAAGTTFFSTCNLVVYRDRIYTQIDYGSGNTEIMQYDGVSFLPLLPLPVVSSQTKLFLRDDDLIIQPYFIGARHAIEYNGSEFMTILAPKDFILTHYLNVSDCNYIWTSYTDMGFEDPYHWMFLKEAKDSCTPQPPPPPPPPLTAVMVIPEHFIDYDRIDLKFDGNDRGWCWNEVIFDWGTPPVCSIPPCPDPVYQIRFANPGGKIAWQENFTKPFKVPVPLKDNKPYIASIFSVNKEATQPLIVMDDNLVHKGITTIKLSMKPTSEYFNLSASTDKNIKIPLKVSLLNAKGKPIWEKEFIAPFYVDIADKVKEPGQTLFFTVPQGPKQSSESSVITSFNFYPNPAKGQLALEVKTGDKIVNTELTIASMQGEILLKKVIQAPFMNSVTLPPRKPGLYILKLKTGDEILTKLLWLE
jgi:hypothetical protein